MIIPLQAAYRIANMDRSGYTRSMTTSCMLITSESMKNPIAMPGRRISELRAISTRQLANARPHTQASHSL